MWVTFLLVYSPSKMATKGGDQKYYMENSKGSWTP